MSENPYEVPKSQAMLTDREDLPELWNPGAAASWSLLFSPAFGAYVHMLNWQALGEEKKAFHAKIWIAVYFVFLLFSLFGKGLITTPNAFGTITRFMGLAILLSWYFSSGKAQINYVKEKFGNEYPRRGWIALILAAISVWCVIFFVAAVWMG